MASDQEEKQKGWQEEEGVGTRWAQEGGAGGQGLCTQRQAALVRVKHTLFSTGMSVWAEGLEGP